MRCRVTMPAYLLKGCSGFAFAKSQRAQGAEDLRMNVGPYWVPEGSIGRAVSVANE